MTIARAASEAWEQLKLLGGIEPAGRDKDLALALQKQLGGKARTLDEALSHTTTDELVRALLGAIEPYSAIYSDILRFFRRARATDTKRAITLALKDIPFNLRDFEKFITASERVPGAVEVVLLNRDQIMHLANLLSGLSGKSQPSSDPDVSRWVFAADHGRQYEPFPPSLFPNELPQELRSAAAIAAFALQTLRNNFQTRGEAREFLRGDKVDPARAVPIGRYDIAYIENDHFVGHLIAGIDAAKSLPTGALAVLGAQIDTFLAGAPRKRLKRDRALLERVLSLPAWRYRHELYGVWIATQIIENLPDHRVKIHAPNGILAFSSTETRLATITGSRKFSLFAERWSPLANPVGKGRRDGTKPDYGFWSGPNDEDCNLIVEVKHYKKVSMRNFRSALIDYANAHPRAEVVLVNYGPNRDVLGNHASVTHSLRTRCHQIGHLTPFNIRARSEFAAHIRRAAGPSASLLVIDVSGSMIDFISPAQGHSALDLWLSKLDPDAMTDVRLVDTCELARGSIEEIRVDLGRRNPSGATNLVPMILDYLREVGMLTVATDAEGLEEIKGHKGIAIDERSEYAGLQILRLSCSRSSFS